MAIKKTFQVGDNPIRSRAEAVKDVCNKKIQKVIRDLIDTMRHENLVGMVAPQIGEGKRIFVTEIRKTTIRKNLKQDELRVFINPRIKKHSMSIVKGYEGCGSVGSANLFGPVNRFKTVIVTAVDGRGSPFQLEASGLLARVIQHEIDHLNGVVFLDKVKDNRKLLGKEEYIGLMGKK